MNIIPGLTFALLASDVFASRRLHRLGRAERETTAVELKDSLRLERYKLVTSRQAWVVDIARGVFTAYATTLAAFVAGAISLVSASGLSNKLSADTVIDLMRLMASFLTFAAVLSTAQITFCLVRWYEYRHAECKINPDAPKPETWAWLFEGMYIGAMGASVGLIWWGFIYLSAVVAKH